MEFGWVSPTLSLICRRVSRQQADAVGPWLAGYSGIISIATTPDRYLSMFMTRTACSILGGSASVGRQPGRSADYRPGERLGGWGPIEVERRRRCLAEVSVAGAPADYHSGSNNGGQASTSQGRLATRGIPGRAPILTSRKEVVGTDARSVISRYCSRWHARR